VALLVNIIQMKLIKSRMVLIVGLVVTVRWAKRDWQDFISYVFSANGIKIIFIDK